ncbi:MAG: septation protein A [Methylotenera sp.]|nr:septation protein A [Methylotenera sp.]MDO9232770.1 septation protein A [Methylotenera sp.]MDO9389691.1 septation protein A [Methylotenera sp.]MDP1595924.1 septation protein A [Methylotenera sp.]MDP1755768.1 septation protein A [Methylotenera sp.]
MKFLFDLFPVILFFVAFKFFGIFTATAVAIVATIAQIIYVKIRHGVVEKMLLISGVIITVFGGATLLLKDPTFIQWKPSILYWLFAAGLLGAQLLFNKNPMRSMMGKQIQLPDAVWSKLNIAWAMLFVALGFLNLYVAFNYSQDTWVNFKLFGITGIMFVFIIVQTLFISKYLPKEDSKEDAQ